MEQIPADGVAPVVHVISDAGPHPFFRTLIEAGQVDPRSVVVGCVGPAGALQDDMRSLDVRSFSLGARHRLAYPAATLRLARLLRRLGAPVVQTHLVDGSLVGLSAARLARTPLAVFTAHHSHELPFHGRKLLWADKLCVGPLSDRIIAPSRQVAETLVSFTGVDERKIEVIHHGFDLSALDPARVDGGTVRAEYGLDQKLVFGAVGRIYQLKNHAAMIEAFAAVMGRVEDARLLIVGPGETDALAALARRLSVGDQVIFAGPRTDVPAVLASLDAFVHPAIAESFGMVIVEAMSLARPVLSTRVGIAPEVIQDGVTGVLSEGHDSSDLAAGMERLMGLRARWPEMGSAARRDASRFTATAMARRYQGLYAEVGSERSAGGFSQRASRVKR